MITRRNKCASAQQWIFPWPKATDQPHERQTMASVKRVAVSMSPSAFRTLVLSSVGTTVLSTFLYDRELVARLTTARDFWFNRFAAQRDHEIRSSPDADGDRSVEDRVWQVVLQERAALSRELPWYDRYRTLCLLVLRPVIRYAIVRNNRARSAKLNVHRPGTSRPP